MHGQGDVHPWPNSVSLPPPYKEPSWIPIVNAFALSPGWVVIVVLFGFGQVGPVPFKTLAGSVFIGGCGRGLEGPAVFGSHKANTSGLWSSAGSGDTSHTARRYLRCGGGSGGNSLRFAFVFGMDNPTGGSGNGLSVGGGSGDADISGVLASIVAIKLSRRAMCSAS